DLVYLCICTHIKIAILSRLFLRKCVNFLAWIRPELLHFILNRTEWNLIEQQNIEKS
uniref:Uncharacterized protein n=1 Tax=Megaselia scalaris TaxID=36166 RepID=T1H6X4_MEGSC